MHKWVHQMSRMQMCTSQVLSTNSLHVCMSHAWECRTCRPARVQAEPCGTGVLRNLNVLLALGCCAVAGAIHKRLHPQTPSQLSSAMVSTNSPKFQDPVPTLNLSSAVMSGSRPTSVPGKYASRRAASVGLCVRAECERRENQRGKHAPWCHAVQLGACTEAYPQQPPAMSKLHVGRIVADQPSVCGYQNMLRMIQHSPESVGLR